jgi:predicted transcriptional regulator
MENQILLELTAGIVSTHVANNQVPVGDVSDLLRNVYAALDGLDASRAAPAPDKRETAVSVRASVKPDYLVCLECGRKQKTLKRHLRVAHGQTPAEYRAGFGLPDSYPMTAASYSEKRRDLAKAIGLGRKRTGGEAARAPATGATPKRRGRPPKARNPQE